MDGGLERPLPVAMAGSLCLRLCDCRPRRFLDLFIPSNRVRRNKGSVEPSSSVDRHWVTNGWPDLCVNLVTPRCRTCFPGHRHSYPRLRVPHGTGCLIRYRDTLGLAQHIMQPQRLTIRPRSTRHSFRGRPGPSCQGFHLVLLGYIPYSW